MSAAVAELKKKHRTIEVEIVKKTSIGLLQRMSLPKFPAVEIDGAVLFEGIDVSAEQLEAAVEGRRER